MKTNHAGKRILFLIISTVLLVSWIPLASNLLKLILFLLSLTIYAYMFYSIAKLILDYKKFPETDNTLVQLYINILLTFSCSYFFIAAIDVDGSTITNLRAFNTHFTENYTLVGIIEYINGLGFTFMNCLYYSLVVMATLGDSSVELKNILPRMIVMFQVGYTIWLTGYAISNHFNNKSSAELKKVETNLKSEIKQIIDAPIKTDTYIEPSLKTIFNKVIRRIRYSLGQP